MHGRLFILAIAVAVAIYACGTSDVSLGSQDAGQTEAGVDASVPDGSCRTRLNCPGGYACLLPGQTDARVCHVATPPDQKCPTVGKTCVPPDAGADAGSDFVCQTAGCSDTACGRRCTGDADCFSNAFLHDWCDVATGLCQRAQCKAAFCGSDTVCDPRVGCTPKKCTSDGECSGGCVNGACVPGLGTCSFDPK
jgi:hypothetical protein